MEVFICIYILPKLAYVKIKMDRNLHSSIQVHMFCSEDALRYLTDYVTSCFMHGVNRHCIMLWQ